MPRRPRDESLAVNLVQQAMLTLSIPADKGKLPLKPGDKSHGRSKGDHAHQLNETFGATSLSRPASII